MKAEHPAPVTFMLGQSRSQLENCLAVWNLLVSSAPTSLISISTVELIAFALEAYTRPGGFYGRFFVKVGDTGLFQDALTYPEMADYHF